jgi:hypothetical protein
VASRCRNPHRRGIRPWRPPRDPRPEPYTDDNYIADKLHNIADELHYIAARCRRRALERDVQDRHEPGRLGPTDVDELRGTPEQQ